MFWEMVQRHYEEHSLLEFYADILPETKISEIRYMVAARVGFDQGRFSEAHIPTYILAGEELAYIADNSIDLAKLKEHYAIGDDLHLIFSFLSVAGDIWREDGVRYYMHSKEAGSHHEPHVHVDYRHEATASVAIKDGELLDGVLPLKVLKRVRKRIMDNQKFLFECWNKMTDGLYVDIDHYFGIKTLEM